MLKFPSLRFAKVPDTDYYVVEPTVMVKTLSAVQLERSKDSSGLIDGTANAFYATLAILSLYRDARIPAPGTLVMMANDPDSALLFPTTEPRTQDLVSLLPDIVAAYKSEQVFGARLQTAPDTDSLPPVNLVDSDRSPMIDFAPGTPLAEVLDALSHDELKKVRDFWMSNVPDTFLASIYKTIKANNFWNLGVPAAGN